MKKTKLTRSLLAAVSVVALSAVVYGCSGGISDAEHRAALEEQQRAADEAARAAEEAARLAAEEAARKAEEEKQAALEEERRKAAEAEDARLAQIQDARDAIAAAETAGAAQAAKDAVDDVATASEAAGLQAAVDARVAELATMGRADAQMMALMTAAGMIDTSDLTTAADIAAANTAIAALKMAIAAAVDVDDTSMYQTQVDMAEAAVAAAQGRLDHAAQTEVLSGAVAALQAIDLGDLSTQAKIDAADAAIADLRAALAAATELSDGEKAAAMTELATASRTVMTAQGRVDRASQMMTLSDAVDALAAIDTGALMTQEQIDAAEAAIIALDLALAAATDLTDAEKLDATVDVTVAKRRVASAQTALDDNVDDQRTALMSAGDALGEIDLDDLDTQEKIDAAKAAVDDLEMALDDATHLSDSEKAAYQTQLNTASDTVRTAETGLNRDQRMTAQRTTIMNAVTMARTAVAGVNDESTDSEVASADSAIAALETAIAGAEDLPDGDTDVATAQGTLETLQGQLAAAKTSRMAAMEEAEEQRMKDMAATGKALHAALAGPGTDMNALDNVTNSSIVSQGLNLTVPADAGAITGAVDKPVTIPTGDSVGALGSWNGTDYMYTNTGTKVVNEARVYNNRGAGTSKAFADVHDVHTEATAGDDIKGYYTVDEAADVAKVGGATFTHSGTQSHTYDTDSEVGFMTRGTFDGASGTYRCTGDCSSTNDGRGSPSALGGVWHFKPDAGAMVMQPDANYLYYGWWVNKDKDGVPKVASAFAGIVGDVDGDTTTAGGRTLTGSATYAGNAVGKFAMTNVLDGTGNGGHFTANAMLSAIFGDPGAGSELGTIGITGTIDNFRLNDGSEDPGWSVELKNAGFDAGANTFGGTGNEAATVWSINGNKAAESGEWSGQMYDEMPGDAPDGDGSNIPTTVTGTFYSEFSTVGRMVGAFGANKQ